jgi:hypothetical protein
MTWTELPIGTTATTWRGLWQDGAAEGQAGLEIEDLHALGL